MSKDVFKSWNAPEEKFEQCVYCVNAYSYITCKRCSLENDIPKYFRKRDDYHGAENTFHKCK